MAVFEKLGNYKDLGLLILRVGAGALIMTHGVPKLMAGIETWEKVGGAMSMFGLKIVPTFWGFMAAVAEGIGGLFIILGLFFRPAAFLALFTMIVAVVMHFSNGDGVKGAESALFYGIVFLSLFILGPGRYSVDKK